MCICTFNSMHRVVRVRTYAHTYLYVYIYIYVCICKCIRIIQIEYSQKSLYVPAIRPNKPTCTSKPWA